jgi:uncharacterized membrane protein YhaH (DUF805 family)
MKALMRYFLVTLLISFLVGILLPLGLGVKDSTYIAISFTLVWAIYSLILLGYVFLVEGRRNRDRSRTREEQDPFSPKLIQEWEVLWEVTVKKSDQEEKKILWN